MIAKYEPSSWPQNMRAFALDIKRIAMSKLEKLVHPSRLMDEGASISAVRASRINVCIIGVEEGSERVMDRNKRRCIARPVISTPFMVCCGEKTSFATSTSEKSFSEN